MSTQEVHCTLPELGLTGEGVGCSGECAGKDFCRVDVRCEVPVTHTADGCVPVAETLATEAVASLPSERG